MRRRDGRSKRPTSRDPFAPRDLGSIRAGILTLATFAVSLGALGGCELEATGEPRVPNGDAEAIFRSRNLEISTQDDGMIQVTVELADTDDLRAIGLTNRRALTSSAGMLLMHDEPKHAEVWMKNTAIPLSAAWFDETGRIVWIEDLAPCQLDPCRRYAAPTPVIGVLEVNRGAFDEWGVAVGDIVRIVEP